MTLDNNMDKNQKISKVFERASGVLNVFNRNIQN